MSDTWHVASLVVQVRPDSEQALLQHLRALPGIKTEIIENRGDGRLALLAEGPRRDVMRSLLDSLQTLPGVISVAPVYREALPLSDMNQEPSE